MEAAHANEAQPTIEYVLAPAALMQPKARDWDVLAEVVKQAADQPLHFAMSAGPVWLSRCLTATPWYGWAVVPALAYREWRQWPSQRWWDPALDAGFLVLGLVVATWSGRILPGPSPFTALCRCNWRAFFRRMPVMLRHPPPAEHRSS